MISRSSKLAKHLQKKYGISDSAALSKIYIYALLKLFQIWKLFLVILREDK